MERISVEKVTFKAIDGSIFPNKVLCIQYEQSLPRHLYFCLQQKYSQANLMRDSYWCVGYDVHSFRTVHTQEGFLREACVDTQMTSTAEVYGYYKGILTNVIACAVESDRWWSERYKFIKEIVFIHVE